MDPRITTTGRCGRTKTTEQRSNKALWLLLPLLLLACTGLWSQQIYLGNNVATGPRCHCLNNATNLANGQFLDTIRVASAPGETWQISSATGVFSVASPAPPAAPVPIAIGQVLNEVVPGIYELIVRHVDANGFSLTVNNGITPLSIQNTCYYPNVAIVGLPDTVCISSLPVTLTANNNGAAGTGVFRINGQPATVFSAQVLPPATYTVSYTFDAGTGTAGNPNDPGCTTTVSKQVVVPVQPNTAVIVSVNVTLGQDCQAVITPRMMLMGAHPCLDDFVIRVFDQNGFDIGNTINGTHAGQRLNVRVMSEAGALVGDGQIDIFDVDAPTITCAPGNSMPSVTNEIQLLNGSIPNTAATFIPNNFACYNVAVAPMSGTHYYTLQEITVTTTDVYTIELDASIAGGGVFGIYQGAFNPFQGPCQGIVGVSEPLLPGEGYYTNVDGVTRLHVMLMPGMPYTLLTTAYAGNQIGSYQYAFYSVGSGQIVNLPVTSAAISLPLYCSSVPGLINNPTSVNLLGAPVVVDACMLNPPVTFTDQFTNGGNCGVSTISRTFTVRDQSNNSAQCTQQITFSPLSLTEVNYPPRTVNISCGTTFATTPNGNPSPTVTGYPFVITASGAFNIAPRYCNLLGNFEDLPRILVCTGTSQFVRRWVVFDDCDPGSLMQFDQLIVIGDRTGPVVRCPAPDTDQNGQPDTLIYSTQGSICTATLEVPQPIVTDDCSNWTVTTQVVTQLQVPVTNPFGQVTGYTIQTSIFATIPPNGNRLITNIPVGTHFFRYTATDDCGNTGMVECPFRVQDFSPPTAACDDLIRISLGSNGQGVITANDIDEGSSDNCGPVTLAIRRSLDFVPADCSPTTPAFTPWGPSVNLYCCEVGDTVSVNLRVTDLSGNINNCSTQVVIEDRTPPVCLAPQPVITTCVNLSPGTDFNNTNTLQGLFGMAQSIDACAAVVLTELTPQVNMQNCGLGSILRRFSVSDPAGNTSTCQQLITINGSTNYEIKFPRDVIGECAEPGADTLIVNNLGCDQFAITSSDQVFTVTAGACYKIMRTYRVINWCEYDGFSPPVDVSRNPGCAATGGTQDVWVLRRTDGTTYLDIDNNPANNFPAAGTRGTSCDGQSNPAGYWQTIQSIGNWTYTQTIKVIDSNPPVITATPPTPFCSNVNGSCTGLATINFTVTDGCAAAPPTLTLAVDVNTTGQFTTGATLNGTYPNYTVTGTFPLGNHRLRITANDACSNTVTRLVDFRVVDCQSPGLLCNSSIAVVLMPQQPGVDADGDGDFDVAALAVNVNLFVNSTGEDCTGPLRFTLHRIDQIASGADVPFPNHPALVVTCEDIGFLPVRVYAWDSANNPTAVQPDGTVGGPNYTTCDALLQVQDNNGLCTSFTIMGNISGLIMTEEGVPVAGVAVRPREDLADEMMTTEDNGLYTFEVSMGENYFVTPYSSEDYLNGVSTIDIILIAKHILGVTPLGSPYKLIAADINHSNSVTTLDLVHLRKAILGISQGFPNNHSWRFVSAAFDFPDPADPWLEAFPEAVNIPALHQNISNADFIAVKIGDINGNVHANFQESGEGRAAGATYYLRTDDAAYEAGETVEAIFTAANDQDEVQGFQFTLQFDPSRLAFADIEWGQVQPEHVNKTLADNGLLTISWNASPSQGDLGQSELTFFSVRFTARQAGRLSESIGLTSRQLRAEAYAWDDSVRDIALNFAPAKQSEEGFFLEQNRPNPFGDQTIIGFQIPTGGTVTLTIYDTNGKVVQQYQKYYAAGYNQLLVAAQDISARGLLYYKLETDQFAATKKMVILDSH